MIEYIAGTSHGAPKPIRPPCVFTGKSAGEYASLWVRSYLSSTHRPPSPRSASPHASTARRKQMGKQSYSPNQSMSDGRSCASEKAARVACSQLNMAASNKVLAFSNKAPKPEEGHQNSLRALYSQNREAGLAPKKYTRHIPQAPERILDAPELLDDYYLNLLDWGKNNVLAVALGDSIYLWAKG